MQGPLMLNTSHGTILHRGLWWSILHWASSPPREHGRTSCRSGPMPQSVACRPGPGGRKLAQRDIYLSIARHMAKLALQSNMCCAEIHKSIDRRIKELGAAVLERPTLGLRSLICLQRPAPRGRYQCRPSHSRPVMHQRHQSHAHCPCAQSICEAMHLKDIGPL